jgi:hypothetical protein
MAESDWGSQSTYGTGTGNPSASPGDVKSRVQEAASKIGQSAASAVDSGRTAAAEHLHSTAEGLRSASDRLPGGPKVRDFANRTADGLDRTVRYLRDTQASDMWTDIQEGAKARPVPFLVGAVAIGFVAGRLLRRG